MNKWFESTVKYSKEDEQGLLKNVTEKYLVDAISHTEAEAIMYKKMGERVRGDFTVARLVPVNYSDVFVYDEEAAFYKAKMYYTVVDELSAKEKKVTQYVLINAHSVKEAYDRTFESLSNMLVRFEVTAISETPILEVFPFEKE